MRAASLAGLNFAERATSERGAMPNARRSSTQKKIQAALSGGPRKQTVCGEVPARSAVSEESGANFGRVWRADAAAAGSALRVCELNATSRRYGHPAAVA